MKYILTIAIALSAFIFTACPPGPSGGNNQNSTPANKAPETEETGIRVVERPAKIAEMIKARGEQDQAKPMLTIESPTEGEVINNSTVTIKIKVGGDLKGLKMGKNEEGKGNHVHVILDNQPYAAFYDWDKGFELRNVTDGEHTLRMFPSRPWHQSFKNKGAFQMVRFSVKSGGADETKPTTDGNGNTMADAKSGEKQIEGTDVAKSNAGDVDPAKPLLTYSRPKGEYKGEDAEAIMLDFWLSNASLKGDGGDYRVRFTVNGGKPLILDKWEPVWLAGWNPGKNEVKLELIDNDGNLVPNGGYNSTSREITVTP